MNALLCLAAFATFLPIALATGPGVVRGVNLGSLFVVEPWMLETKWAQMGGQNCANCSECIRSEYALTESLGQEKANKVFEEHWRTWFTDQDVKALKKYNLNTIRIPVPWYMIEQLKNTEDHYPSGSLMALKRVLRMLKEAQFWVILDIHALPGVSSSYQMFAGKCVESGFYTEENYQRGLNATAAFTALIHGDEDFSYVYNLLAINEPEQDPVKTPGLGDYYKRFVETVRATEQWMGIDCAANATSPVPPLDEKTKKLILQTLKSVKPKSVSSHSKKSSGNTSKTSEPPKLKGYSTCITASFMAASWQYADPQKNNPRNATIGPSSFEDHTYFNFGYVAENATQEAYMKKICNWDRIQQNVELDNTPLVAGEYWLAVEDTMPMDQQFIQDWGDAQKLTHAAGGGWVFWNFKMEKGAKISTQPGNVNGTVLNGVLRDYRQSVEAGFLTRDATKVFNENVCDKWIEK